LSSPAPVRSTASSATAATICNISVLHRNKKPRLLRANRLQWHMTQQANVPYAHDMGNLSQIVRIIHALFGQDMM
jgi:hypothetical protein